MTDIKIAIVGEGAIADIHMASLRAIPDISVIELVAGVAEEGRTFAEKWTIPQLVTFEQALAGPAAAIVITSPSALHSQQALRALEAGKHVLVEIPIGVSLAECEELERQARTSGLVVMPCHSRRFSPAHRHLKAEIEAGRQKLQHLVAHTYFMRRQNLNMLGKPRSWTDSLLWHHATHTIDLFMWLTEDPAPQSTILAGPRHPELGCIMDMTIGLRAASGSILSLALSFNNDGPFGGFYRYICDNGTFHVFRDALQNADGDDIVVSGAAFLDQDRAFIGAIRQQSPALTISDVLPAMKVVSNLSNLAGVGA